MESILKHCSERLLIAAIALLLPVSSGAFSDGAGKATEEKAIKDVLAEFYAGWNAHDVNRMISAYADDVDHINTRAEWSKGKAAIQRALTRAHSGPLKNNQKTYTVEKIRFVRPDVAVVQVRSMTRSDDIGNLGTYVLSKGHNKWQVVSFTNIEYKLSKAAEPR